GACASVRRAPGRHGRAVGGPLAEHPRDGTPKQGITLFRTANHHLPMLFRLSVTPEPLLFIFCNSMLPEVSPLHSLDLLHVPGNVGRHQVYPTTRRNSFNSCEAVGDDASAPRRR